MNHPPLKRHESLQPLSRDHYAGLVQAHRMRTAADDDPARRLAALEDFVHEWDSLIAEHLRDEEHLLSDLIGERQLIARLLDEHDQLRLFATAAKHFVERYEAPAADWMRKLAALLHDHIRWEERELFPVIETNATAAELAVLSRATDVIENQRPRWDKSPNGATKSK